MKKNVLIVSGAIIILAVAAYFIFKKDTWTGFYYPNGCLTCQNDYIYSPKYDNRTDCLAWATNLKRQRNNPDDKYECGKNCKAPETSSGLYVCKETVDY